ncbi:hypothetical protein [Hymenobacter sp. CRA2]|uniref:hypothetical protein n=1 Tax=Hymenobacter sp. CRA2 TaxID=1955620 RepID=UPI00098E93D5|nr:hypothetical protein [Hymenobacter sp. CRA2]OON67805.1 hypothetical protein B0919_16605 [Hymenobacter sp. CRA2]
MGYWSNKILDLVGINLISGRKNTAANLRIIYGGIADAVAFLEGLQRGARILHGDAEPNPADGLNGDAYLNLTNGDFYLKQADDWGLRVVLRGQNGKDGRNGRDGKTPVLGVDYTVTNGADGRSAYQIWLDQGNTGSAAQFLASLKGADGANGVIGNKNRYESYAPTTENGTVGDVWFHAISASKVAIYECLGPAIFAMPISEGNLSTVQTNWRLRFTSPDGGSSSGSGSLNGVTLTSFGDGTKFLSNDGTYRTPPTSASTGAAVNVEQDFTSNSTSNAPSVKATADALNLKLDKIAKATGIEVQAGVEDGRYITPKALNDGSIGLETYLQDIPAQTKSDVANPNNWTASNRWNGPAIPNGLDLKEYFILPTFDDPQQPGYWIKFLPGNKVVRMKCTHNM